MKKIVIQNLIVSFSFFTILFIVGLVLLLLTKDINNEEIVTTAKFCGATTLGLTIFMIVYQIFFIKKNKISINDFDIRPKQSTTIAIDKSIEETQRIVENILPAKIHSSRFIYNKDLYIYEAKITSTMSSWGERIIIKITKSENFKTQVFVLSKPILPTTIIDYGKSSLNIHRIKLIFEQNGL